MARTAYKMETVKKWLDREGFDAAPIGNCWGDDWVQTGWLVRLDFGGEQVPNDIWEMHERIFDYSLKAGWKYEQAGHYSGCRLLRTAG